MLLKGLTEAQQRRGRKRRRKWCGAHRLFAEMPTPDTEAIKMLFETEWRSNARLLQGNGLWRRQRAGAGQFCDPAGHLRVGEFSAQRTAPDISSASAQMSAPMTGGGLSAEGGRRSGSRFSGVVVESGRREEKRRPPDKRPRWKAMSSGQHRKTDAGLRGAQRVAELINDLSRKAGTMGQGRRWDSDVSNEAGQRHMLAETRYKRTSASAPQRRSAGDEGVMAPRFPGAKVVEVRPSLHPRRRNPMLACNKEALSPSPPLDLPFDIYD